MDFKEKKRLISELYCKKLLFKCFASWVNVALCVSEEDDQNNFDQYSEDDEVASVSCDDRYD